MRQSFIVCPYAAIALAARYPTPAIAQRATPTPKPEQYLCVTDHSAGVVYSAPEKSWRPTIFRPDAKYIVAKSSRPTEAFQVTQVGQSIVSYRCKEGFNEYGYLSCRGLGDFTYNKKNGRFLATHTVGYVNVGLGPELTDANSDTPSVAIGKCSPF